MQNLNLESEALYSLKIFLEQFVSSLLSLKQTYQNKMSGLIDGNISIQVSDTYCRDFWHKNDLLLREVICNFREMDYPYVLRQIQAVEAATAAAGGRPTGAGSGGVSGRAASFRKGREAVEEKFKPVRKKCALCGKEFETIFAGNQFCTVCLKKLMTDRQNERTK